MSAKVVQGQRSNLVRSLKNTWLIKKILKIDLKKIRTCKRNRNYRASCSLKRIKGLINPCLVLFSQQSMIITPNGVSGLNAMLLVEEVLKHEQGIAPSLSMVERTAVTWG